MTRIRMDWRTLELTAEGHAGGGPKGQDIVCAGISALIMALVNQLNAEKQNRLEWTESAEEGRIRIITDPPDNIRPRVKHYYQVIMTGLKAWEQAFPENIRTEEVNRDGTA